MLFLARNNATLKNKPTPIATHIISTIFGIDGTCCANTCKLGSEIVIKTPKIKQIINGAQILLALPILIPMLSPNGSIEIPEPIVKKLIPKIRSKVPNKNRTRTPAFIGDKLTLKMSTIAAIGKTENADSFRDFKRCFKIYLLKNKL